MKHYLIPLILFALLLTACSAPQVGEVTLVYGENGQFELTDPQGQRVLIDVFNPDLLSAPPTDADILLTTHAHPDHINQGFLTSFEGKQLFVQEGEINPEGIKIIGVASAHTAFDHEEYPTEGGSNYIYLIEIGGLRIAHLGDIGQEELTPAQLEVLGKVDIALMQFVNSFSQMDMTNQKGFNLMAQLEPRLIIPTHGNGNMDAMGYGAEQWQASANPANQITIRSSDLNDSIQFVIVGAAANSMQAIFELPDWVSE